MGVSDSESSGLTVDDLSRLVVSFNERRGWRQEHTINDLAKALVIEAAEVLETTLWKDDGVVSRERLADELADVQIYLISLCDRAGLDLANIVAAKVSKNEIRFPCPKEP